MTALNPKDNPMRKENLAARLTAAMASGKNLHQIAKESGVTVWSIVRVCSPECTNLPSYGTITKLDEYLYANGL